MEDNIFDKIYALRINFMDIYYDEKSIIYNIKKNLHKYDGYNDENELNQVIIDFYKTYDIDITTIDLDSIKVVDQPEPFENLINLINSTFIPMDINNNINNNHSTESAYDNESISIDYNNSSVNQEQNEENDSNDDDIDSDDEEIDSDDEVENTLNPELSSNVNYNPLYNSNTLFTFNPNQNISSDQFLSVINMFNTLMNNTQETNYNPSEYEDVVVTLDDNDYNKLKSIKYSELIKKDNKTKETKCSICLVNFEDDDMLLDLPCHHYFHKQCVEEWLKEYDYKCPVCRHECGKTKSNLSQNNM